VPERLACGDARDAARRDSRNDATRGLRTEPGRLGAADRPNRDSATPAPASPARYPVDVLLDSSNNIYVTNYSANSVTKYAAGANGNVSPVLTLAGSNTMIDEPTGVSFDGAGRTFVTNEGSNSITIYPVGASGNTAPTAAISGSNTGLNSPEVAIFSPSGNIYVPNFDGNSVTVYSSGSTGNAPPTATISGSNTGLSGPTSVTFH
jgi:6-phosphogluconolactonase (cycloisomerase 2 family)